MGFIHSFFFFVSVPSLSFIYLLLVFGGEKDDQLNNKKKPLPFFLQVMYECKPGKQQFVVFFLDGLLTLLFVIETCFDKADDFLLVETGRFFMNSFMIPRKELAVFY